MNSLQRNLLRQIVDHYSTDRYGSTADALFDQASDLHLNGQDEEARTCYQALLVHTPNHVGALCCCGILDLLLGDIESGLRLLEHSVGDSLNTGPAMYQIGRLLGSLGQAHLAIKYYLTALSYQPGDGSAELALGHAYRDTHRYENAFYHYDRSIQLDQGMHEAWLGRGVAAAEIGRMSEAKTSLETAIAINPLDTDAFLALSSLLFDCDHHRGHLERLMLDDRIPDFARSNIHFSLGHIYSDRKEYRESLTHFLRANALRRPYVSYNETRALELMKLLPSIFTSAVLNDGHGETSEAPIFIIGMPRSGSTLIEQILSSHRDVYGIGESSELDRVLAINGLSDELITDFEQFASLQRHDYSSIGRSYLTSVRSQAPRARRIVNKMLSNFRMLGVIRLILPNAKIIHATRNAVDTCVSCFGRAFPPAFTYDLGELGRYYRSYDQLMHYWTQTLPDWALEVKYESLVGDFEAQARRIVDFCGLAWDERCLNYHELRRPVATSSAYQVRQPIYSGSVGRWQGCEDLLEPLCREL